MKKEAAIRSLFTILACLMTFPAEVCKTSNPAILAGSVGRYGRFGNDLLALSGCTVIFTPSDHRILTRSLFLFAAFYNSMSARPLQVTAERTVSLTVYFIHLKLICHHLSITVGLGVCKCDHGDSASLLPQFCLTKKKT